MLTTMQLWWSHSISNIYTSEDVCTWKCPMLAWYDDSRPKEVSGFNMFDGGGGNGWFEGGHLLAKLKTFCVWFSKCVPLGLRCRDRLSSPNKVLIWERLRGCSTPGKHIGCKFNPFLIDNIWNSKYRNRLTSNLWHLSLKSWSKIHN